MQCSVDGCERAATNKAAALCNRHYLRLRRHGSPTAGGPEYGLALEWISKNIPADTDECLLWPFGRFADGYGGVQVDGKKQRAHRYICRMVHGDPEDESMDAAHTCGNGHLGCVNDRHLYWATREQNCRDTRRHGRENSGERNGQSVLTEDQARQILALSICGRSQSSVARQFGVSRKTVVNIWSGRTWRHIRETGDTDT